MKFNNRKIIIFAGITLLVMLNIWRWWPASKQLSGTVDEKKYGLNIEEFQVKAIPVDVMPPLSRDIFSSKQIVVAKPKVIIEKNVISLVPVKPPEQVAKENAELELSKIRCVGISVRNERVQAYIINAGEPMLISKGDKVGSRFLVENIVSDSVILQDTVTGVSETLSISGK